MCKVYGNFNETISNIEHVSKDQFFFKSSCTQILYSD